MVELDFAAGADRLVAIAQAGEYYPHRVRRLLAHDVDLPGAGVRPQHLARFGGEERVPHIPRRVVRRHIEQFEIVLVGFDFAGPVDLETEFGEYGRNLAEDLRCRVQPTARGGATGQSHIERIRIQTGLQRRFLGNGQRAAVSGLEGQLHPVRFLPERRA